MAIAISAAAPLFASARRVWRSASRFASRSLPVAGRSPPRLALAIVALLISFGNFNTTLMLVGPDPPLTITMYDRLREGSPPVINAVSLFLMIGSGLLGLISVMAQRDRTAEKPA